MPTGLNSGNKKKRMEIRKRSRMDYRIGKKRMNLMVLLTVRNKKDAKAREKKKKRREGEEKASLDYKETNNKIMINDND